MVGIGRDFETSPARIAGAVIFGLSLVATPSLSENASWTPGTPSGTRYELQLKKDAEDWGSTTEVDAAGCSEVCRVPVGELDSGIWQARVRACDQALCTVWVESIPAVKPGSPGNLLILR